jgi:hypothetical protein
MFVLFSRSLSRLVFCERLKIFEYVHMRNAELGQEKTQQTTYVCFSAQISTT